MGRDIQEARSSSGRLDLALNGGATTSRDASPAPGSPAAKSGKAAAAATAAASASVPKHRTSADKPRTAARMPDNATVTSFSRDEKVSETYYDDADADKFYELIWGGGTDIHVGTYLSASENIYDASRRTVRVMAQKLERTGILSRRATEAGAARGIDLGAGYGGPARYLATTYGAYVECLNISDAQNARNRQLTLDTGLQDRVSVTYGSYQDVPSPDSCFDFAWSQDAIDHAPDKTKVFQETYRVLRPGGEFLFTDLIKADDVPASELSEILARIKLPDMGSFKLYIELAEAAGFEVVDKDEQPDCLRMHYTRVSQELARQDDLLAKHCSAAFRQRMQAGLQHWVSGATPDARGERKLNWGYLHLRKPAK